MGADIKIGNGSKKIFQTVMGSWREDSSQTLKMGEKQDDEETWGLEGGYSSDRGLSRHSLDYHSGKLGENSSDESEGEQEEEGEDSDGENERTPPLFVGAKTRSSKTNSDDVLASPTKIRYYKKLNWCLSGVCLVSLLRSHLCMLSATIY
jgi:hypothetical protein